MKPVLFSILAAVIVSEFAHAQSECALVGREDKITVAERIDFEPDIADIYPSVFSFKPYYKKYFVNGTAMDSVGPTDRCALTFMLESQTLPAAQYDPAILGLNNYLPRQRFCTNHGVNPLFMNPGKVLIPQRATVNDSDHGWWRSISIEFAFTTAAGKVVLGELRCGGPTKVVKDRYIEFVKSHVGKNLDIDIELGPKLQRLHGLPARIPKEI